jgi:predicted nucleic acid-binding protein
MCLTSRSPFHIIYQSLIQGKFTLAISTEILLEYEEIIQQKYGVVTAKTFIALLKELPNIKYNIAYYKWRLIEADEDDNKYSDCAIAVAASYLVTEDKHFSIFKNISFPKLTVISIDEFTSLLRQI